MGIPASISGARVSRIFSKQALGAVQHAEIVERAAAAENGLGNGHAKSGGFQHLDRGFGGIGQKIIVEGVGPEHDQRGVGIRR